MSLPDGMATEATDARPNFAALDSVPETSTTPAATPTTTPSTKPEAALSPAKQDDAPAMTDEELAAAPDETTETKDAKTAEATKPTTEPATPSADEWEKIRAKFPTMSLAEMDQMVERDKNTLAGFTKKTQKLAEERKQFEEQRRVATERWGELDSSSGELAMRIAQSLGQDPTLQARLDKAFREVTVDESDVNNVAMWQQKYEMDKRFKEQESRLASIEKTRVEQQAKERMSRAQSLAEKHDIDFDSYYAAMQREVNTLRANGDDPDIDGLLETVALKVKAREEAKNLKFLEKWKNSKRTAARVAPVGSRGGSAAPAPKEADTDTPESRMEQLGKLIGGH
jgi:hypothetical protein